MGLLVTQGVIVFTLILNRRGHSKTHEQLIDLEAHVNNVETDIDHDAEDVSIGQRLRRMERTMQVEFTENTRIHQLLAEGLIANAEEVFKRATYMHSDVGAYIVRKGGPVGWQVTWVSPGYTKIAGMTLGEVQQGDYAQRIHPDDYDRVMGSFQTALEAEVPWDVTYRQLGPNGWQTIHQQAEPFFGLEHDLLGQFGLFRTVDET
jgi:hypothetical protein